jgi:hypothetical protein
MYLGNQVSLYDEESLGRKRQLGGAMSQHARPIKESCCSVLHRHPSRRIDEH